MTDRSWGRGFMALALTICAMPSASAQAPRAAGPSTASPPATSGAPSTPAAVTPKRLTATVIVRDPQGSELRRLEADTRGGARAECAFVQGGAAANTVALAVGTRNQLLLQTQIGDAKSKPALRGLSLTLLETNPDAAATFEFEPGACRLGSAKFDGGNGDFDILCDHAGRELRAPRKIEIKLHVEGCPVMTMPQPQPATPPSPGKPPSPR